MLTQSPSTHIPMAGPLLSPTSQVSGSSSVATATVIDIPGFSDTRANLYRRLSFNANSRLAPDQNPVQQHTKKYINAEVLRHDKNIKISHETTISRLHKKPGTVEDSILVIETGNANDRVRIKNGPDDSLIAIINDKPYQLTNINSADSDVYSLRIKTNGGDDCVLIDPDVAFPVDIDLGDGNDYAQAGSGHTILRGGSGNDTLKLGSGEGVAFGGDDDDLMIAGTGNSVLRGNNGNDRMQADEGIEGRSLYMDGGDGHDFMIVTKNTLNNPTILHGGKGENLIVTHGKATVYTGRDKNIVRSHSDDTVIYAKSTDEVHRTAGSTLTHTTFKEVGHSGYVAEGSQAFVQNVNDDLDLLRLSPAGKQLLAEADAAAKRNDAPTLIKETTADNGFYHFNSLKLKKHFSTNRPDEITPTDQWKGQDFGGIFIKDDLRGLTPQDWGRVIFNKPGDVATAGEIHYNPSFSPSEGGPILTLYHEMTHAYNGANGSFLPGKTKVPHNLSGEHNIEHQAVGLITDTQPFNFINRPSAKPTTTNPKPFTENALREELQLPPREKY
jgi:Ca2+-binding RTX toxin-like protein